MSGVPGSDRSWSLNRNPARCNTDRSFFSGFVSPDRIRRIRALRSDGVRKSATCAFLGPTQIGRRLLRWEPSRFVCSAWIYFPMFPRQNRDTTGVYSRSGLSGTGTTGSVVKIRLPGSISGATAENSPSPTASQRTDPRKADVSALPSFSDQLQSLQLRRSPGCERQRRPYT